MLRLLKTLLRVLIGFAFACLVAGIATVLFVDTPAEIATVPAGEIQGRAGRALELALLTATHSAIFACVFALIAAGVAEWFSIRALTYYLVTGIAIALLGFYAQFQSEVAGQPTILNNYALKAFLTAGFLAGLTYWLFAGRFSGEPRDELPDAGTHTPRKLPPPKVPEPQPADSKASQRARAQARARLLERGTKPVTPSVSSRILDITTDSGTSAAIVAAAAARSASVMHAVPKRTSLGTGPSGLNGKSNGAVPFGDGKPSDTH